MQPIRRQITEIIKEQGSATVAELAEQLQMAQVSVRHHLDVLVGEDLVELSGVRRRDGAGRPSQVYALTALARTLFPRRHEALATDMLIELKASLPCAQVREMFLRIAAKTASEAPLPQPEHTVEERLAQVADFLTQKGYRADWAARGDHYELHTHNCPYAGVAEAHPELCMMDHAMMNRLFGYAIRLQSAAMDGATHCIYAIGAAREGTAPAGQETACESA